MSYRTIILKTAVESRKSAQVLDAPEKHEKALITNKVTTRFSYSPVTPITCTSFSRSTAVFRIMAWLSTRGLLVDGNIIYAEQVLGGSE